MILLILLVTVKVYKQDHTNHSILVKLYLLSHKKQQKFLPDHVEENKLNISLKDLGINMIYNETTEITQRGLPSCSLMDISIYQQHHIHNKI